MDEWPADLHLTHHHDDVDEDVVADAEDVDGGEDAIERVEVFPGHHVDKTTMLSSHYSDCHYFRHHHQQQRQQRQQHPQPPPLLPPPLFALSARPTAASVLRHDSWCWTPQTWHTMFDAPTCERWKTTTTRRRRKTMKVTRTIDVDEQNGCRHRDHDAEDR